MHEFIKLYKMQKKELILLIARFKSHIPGTSATACLQNRITHGEEGESVKSWQLCSTEFVPLSRYVNPNRHTTSVQRR